MKRLKKTKFYCVVGSQDKWAIAKVRFQLMQPIKKRLNILTSLQN